MRKQEAHSSSSANFDYQLLKLRLLRQLFNVRRSLLIGQEREERIFRLINTSTVEAPNRNISHALENKLVGWETPDIASGQKMKFDGRAFETWRSLSIKDGSNIWFDVKFMFTIATKWLNNVHSSM